MPDDPRMKPDFSIQLDGTKLKPEEAAAILGIRVFQTRAGASAFEIVVSDPDLSWQAKPLFIDCKEVQIELGVPGKLKKVFDGEVTAWRTELERAGPTVLVLRGMDRSHRMMRAKKTKTYANASPLDCAQQIASQYGLTAKTRAGSPAPVKMFRFQANQTDFDFLSSMAELEGYMFWVEGSELHFERPQLSSSSDAEFTLGEEIKAFLPVANFRKPPVSVEVGAWDASGKAEITGKAKTGDELWSVPGGQPGAKLAKFSSTKPEWSVVEPQVATQEHADTVAKAALTRRSMEFITAEVEVRGNPKLKPGSMVNLKKVGAYSGNYLVTEANHFFDSAGYSCIFYVARDKWGDSSSEKEKAKSAKDGGKAKLEEKPFKAPQPKDAKPKNEPIDFTLHDDQGKALSNVKVNVRLASGEVIEATTDGDGHVHVDDKPPGPYTIELADGAAGLTTIDLRVEDAEGNPVSGASGKVTLSDGTEMVVMTDSNGEVHLTDVPPGEYAFKLEDKGSGREAPPPATGKREGSDEAEVEEGAEDAEEVSPSAVGRFKATHFETDKTFPLPEAIPTFRQIATHAQEEPGRTLLVLGHTDSQGSLAHNQGLSLARAEAVAAYFRNDADAWLKFYEGGSDAWKQWGAREDQLMLDALPFGGAHYGSLDAFRKVNGIPALAADRRTRRALIAEYMAADGTTTPDPVEIQTLGCADWHKADRAARGKSETNRRVEVLVFENADFKPPASQCTGHGGSGDKGTCTAYDLWISAASDMGDPGSEPGQPKAQPATEPIEAITGPAQVAVGKNATYSISKDRRTAAKRGEPARWRIQVLSGQKILETIDPASDPRFVVEPDRLILSSVPGQWSHRRLVVQAYALAPNDRARVETAVVLEPIVIADSWTNPDASGNRPGVGRDFGAGDMTEQQYRDIGFLFDADFRIPGGLGSQTDDQLFSAFRTMAVDIFSSGELVANTNAMIDKLKRNEGGEYTNAVLTRKAREHDSTKRFLANLRGKLSASLGKLDGDAGKVTRVPRIPSPVYGTLKDKFMGGLTIAVNDTWAYEVVLVDYEMTGPHAYRARVTVRIYDHFGLDKADLEDKAINALAGFRAWLLLQRVRGYKPFVTRIEFDEQFEDSF